jgi:hypothetical protein
MGRVFNRRWKIIAIAYLFVYNGLVAQSGFKNNNHMLFLVKLEAVEGDTITFSTVDIYLLQKIPRIENLKDSLGNPLPFKHNYKMFCERSFTKGVLKHGLKKKDIGQLFFLSSTGSTFDISEDGIVIFMWREKTKNVDIKSLYPLNRCCD